MKFGQIVTKTEMNKIELELSQIKMTLTNLTGVMVPLIWVEFFVNLHGRKSEFSSISKISLHFHSLRFTTRSSLIHSILPLSIDSMPHLCSLLIVHGNYRSREVIIDWERVQKFLGHQRSCSSTKNKLATWLNPMRTLKNDTKKI